MSEELKSCPFCGGEATREYDSDWGLVVRCLECPAIMTESPYFGVLDPIERWNLRAEPINGETSDGYHTFIELYHHRALLFSVVVRNYTELCWKSKKHYTGDMYEGMFIVGINTPDGQASYHYDIDPYWDMFECEELEFAPEWDGHTPDQAIERIGKLTRHVPERTCHVKQAYFHDCSDLDNLMECIAFSPEDTVACICDSCGMNWRYDRGIRPNYCPHCGAKVVEVV